MANFKFGAKYKSIVKQHEKDSAIAEEAALEKREELTNAIVNIGSKDDKKYGGAGTGVLVKTEYYNKWLVEQQKRNPFIGKSYMQLADEYARDDEDVQKATAMSDETAASALEIDEDGSLHISDDFDPNNVEAVENEKLVGDAAKFSDLCVINNVISRQIGWDFDSLMKEVTDELEKVHIDGCSGTPTTCPLPRETPIASINGRCVLLLGRAMIARMPTPELTWIPLASSAMD